MSDEGMLRGLILRGIGGFYYVRMKDGSVLECKARGRFRRMGLTPMVGDYVMVLRQREGNALIDEILPRRNALVRPPVANIDRLMIVLSASVPHPDFLLCDKLIVEAGLLNIEPVLVLNKCDECDPGILARFLADYAGVFKTVQLSALTRAGLSELIALLDGKISCFAGQSAVGKSSIINALAPELALETGGLAKKTDRGRHTTRHAELFPCFGGALLDTPGFSLYETDLIEQDALDRCYPEFSKLPAECRFPGCMHISEPGCAVKTMLSDGGMSKERYERYCLLAKEYESRRKHRYD